MTNHIIKSTGVVDWLVNVQLLSKKELDSGTGELDCKAFQNPSFAFSWQCRAEQNYCSALLQELNQVTSEYKPYLRSKRIW
jgi:hypothetical protein